MLYPSSTLILEYSNIQQASLHPDSSPHSRKRHLPTHPSQWTAPTSTRAARSELTPTFPLHGSSANINHSQQKLSLSVNNPDRSHKDSSHKTDSPRNFSTYKRFGGDSSHGRSPFNGIASPSSAGISSPSTAFGLGSGAFASFGSSGKTPKTPGQELGSALGTAKTPGEKKEKEVSDEVKASIPTSSSPVEQEHDLKYTWTLFYRPPTSKYSDYEKSIVGIASFATAETFWRVYSHLKRPSSLPSVSDYHIFKKGIRPVWEDAANKKGGKWILRLKKGVADRYWESLLLAIIGDQFAEASEEVCGAVLSVKSGEDVLSVWTRNDGGRNIKIR